MKTATLVVVTGALLSAGPALGWDAHGHMTVAAVAYKTLDAPVREKVDALLKLNPDYPGWVGNASPKNRDLIAFMTASTWADTIRHDATHTSVGDDPSGPNAARNIGYADNLVHPYWHYINIPFSPDGTAVKPPVAPNVKTQIAALRAALASPNTSDDVKSYDLVWLLHLVGDVHQPLHSISRIDHQQPDGDRGGTLVAMCAAPCKYNLHFFWDDALGTSTGPEAAIKEASELPGPDRRLAAIADEATWVDESLQLAKTSVYVDPIGVGPGPFTVDAKYEREAHAIAATQVALAGARLANLLNDSLKTVVVGPPAHGEVRGVGTPGGGVQTIGVATERAVVFNTQSLKYHEPSCPSAHQCTRNCVTIPLSEAIRRGGKPCKRCGGGGN